MNKALLKSCIAFIALLLFCTEGASAQKIPYLQDQEEIVQAAKAYLDQQMAGDLLLWAQENTISGQYVFDITLRKKGEVATVFVSKGQGDIKHQNALKDYVYDLKFPFKLPKAKSYKFSYQFNL